MADELKGVSGMRGARATNRGREHTPMNISDASNEEDQRNLQREASHNQARQSTSDSFDHVEEDVEEYANYNDRGEYASLSMRILPRRYYEGTLNGMVFYKGGAITYVALLEEAIVQGAISLDEELSMWDNVHNAEKALIQDKARPLYPWSTTLYSEDALYTYRTENGKIVEAVRAFYIAADGSRITVRFLAEQLVSGVPPEEMPGGYSFLWETDRELCIKARMLGQAVRMFRYADEAFAEGTISERQYLADIHVYLLYFLGRDEGRKGARQLRGVLEDPDFPRKALKGIIAASAPSSFYRRPVMLRNAFGAFRED